MATRDVERSQRVVVPRCRYWLGWTVVGLSAGALFALNSRASELDTIASALGLYSAALLGVFSVLTSWRSGIVRRKERFRQVEDRWRDVVDRSVKFSLRGSALSFTLMLFAVVAPAVKGQVRELIGLHAYGWTARTVSSIAISGVVLLGLMSLQIVRDITAVYDWNNHVEEQEALVAAQADALKHGPV